ncbi:MAG: PKD domain-containing protein, partial [Phycisphaerae bacterium]
MKTLLSFVFGVSMCCLLPSNGMAADEAKPAKDAAVKASAVSGIALTTHRPGGGDHGFGVAPQTFGEIVRHDIKDNRVVGSRVIYPGKARAAFIDPSGERVVFIKLDGRLHVMKADGTGLKELARTRNRNASAVAWPTGDWVYYSEEGTAPQGVWGDDEKADTPEKRSIRRVNVVSGEDEEVGAAPNKILQLSLALASGKGSGRYAITGHLADLSQPGKAVSSRNLHCGTMVSPSGQYVTEMAYSHADLVIWSWDLGTRMTEFHVNAWAGAAGDGRPHCMRPRWSANSDKWVVLTHGMDFGGTERSNAALYNWKEQIQIQLTHNPLDGQACDEGESFWVAGLPVDFSVIELEGKAPYTIELKSPKVEGEGWKWDFGDGATGSGAVGRHTYTMPGDYIATARKDQSTLRQRVLVLPRKAPRATAVSALDPWHVLVEFDEPVKIEGASARLESGQVAAKLILEPMGRQLVAEFNQPLAAKETLTVTGVTDRAQAPNKVAAAKTPVVLPAWPSNRTGVSYLWQNARSRNVIFDEQIGLPITTSLNGGGEAHFNRFGAAVAAGGGFQPSNGATDRIMGGIHKTKQFSFEIVVAPADLKQTKGNDDKPIAIVDWGFGWRNGIFWLFQEKNQLQVGLSKSWGDGNPEVFEMATLPDTKPHHVIITWAEKRLAFYLDGKKVKEIDPSPAHLLMLAPPMRFAENAWRGQ